MATANQSKHRKYFRNKITIQRQKRLLKSDPQQLKENFLPEPIKTTQLICLF